MGSTLLACVIPGPTTPSDFQPFLDPLVHELVLLYWEGVEVIDSSAELTAGRSGGVGADGAAGMAGGMAGVGGGPRSDVCRCMLLDVLTDCGGYPHVFRYVQAPAKRGEACVDAPVDVLRLCLRGCF